MQNECERRSRVMFGADWRKLCSLGKSASGLAAIVSQGKALSWLQNSLLSDVNGKINDLIDGSPASIAYYKFGQTWKKTHYQNGILQSPKDGTPAYISYFKNGSIQSIGYYQAGERQDTGDGTPALIVYGESGEIARGYSAEKGPLSASETIACLNAAQVRRVAALLAKSEQSVVPSGMPLPESCGVSGPNTRTKDGR